MPDESFAIRRKIGLERRYNRRQYAADALSRRRTLGFRHRYDCSGSRAGCGNKICGRHARLYRTIMLYMVIEHFKEGAAPEIYRRFREKGRMMPDGLEYVSSWIDLDFKVCYQLMQTEQIALFDRWIENWSDLMEFEIVPVRTSAEAVEVMNTKL